MKFNRWLTACSICISSACFSQTALPVKKGNRYELSCMQGQSMGIAPDKGGRITHLTIDGSNFLTDSTVNSDNWGSTFWPSPQSDWNWPPPAAWDNQPYAVKTEEHKIIMESTPDRNTGLSVTKIFSADVQHGWYNLTYIIANHSAVVKHVAPWEVTRVHTNGFSFFPMGKGALRGGLIPQTKIIDGVCWFTYNQQQIPDKGDMQLYADGSEGWFAEVNHGFILIKKFPDIPFEKLAPQEGEVELYANKDRQEKSYVEIEHQGAFTELPPGKSCVWNMQWMLRKLPHSIKPEPGNPELIDYVRKAVK
ncbi:DUF4380 domain-containing protein [Pseudoflavitalea sp. G-6-1-2]|uniref:DUF4380 domain-containing protein n=1 Tax=Pseudoflavitalea sp. G-6-1-2 TaxID=2728841 RepID=UPI00146A1F07|nr:DUF4380 domain-containing protein [Pseudoflavitalea sp. G-6-1-2]NML23116.1 DUF4380 domain-containing protein [Pseudoflavitalea sp. G-6-1-2]